MAFAAVVGTLGTEVAHGQDTSVPTRDYFLAIEELYEGDYRQALRGFQNELRGGIKIGLTQWVDSICYRAMLGETYFQMGNTPQALVEFDAACELFLSNPKWMIAVDFRQPPRPASNAARRIAPWGRPNRQVKYVALPDTMLVQQGEMITEQRLARGGALQSLQMWRVDVVEVVRATALAIRRRGEILGPLGRHDRMSKNLVDALARGDNTQRGHWSKCWTELLLGLAQQGIGESQQALAHLTRATLLDGQYDHDLTGAALLAQANAALEAGNAQAALNLAAESSYAAFAYDDYDVLGEAFEMMHRCFLASDGQGALAPLDVAAQWSDRQNLDHLAAICLLAQAEELVASGDSKLANSRLSAINSRRRDLQAGRLGPWRRYVEAYIAYQQDNSTVGDKAIEEALTQGRDQSLRHFQIALTNKRVDDGRTPTREAVELYATLLRDPTSDDWASQPLETLTNLSTPYEGAFGRWMLSSMDREKVLEAIDITDLAKRRRFWLAQGLGGRLLAIRHLLEGDPNLLPPDAAVERRSLLLRVPEYSKLQEQAAKMRAELEAEPLADETGRVPSARYNLLKRLADNAEKRETLIRRLVLRRDATDMLLPPRVSAQDVQQQLQTGQSVVLFHQAANSFFAFVIVQQDYHHWRLPEAAPLGQKTAEMLRAMGHFSQSRTLEAKNLSANSWKPMAVQYGDLLLGDSRIDLDKSKELIVVPDGVLWHAPLEPLMPSLGGNQKMVIDCIPVRYVPTLGYALPDKVAPRPVRTTIVASEGTSANDFLPRQASEELAGTAAGSVVIDSPVSAPSPLLSSLAEQLIVLANAELDPQEPYAFSPLPLDRSANQGALPNWTRIPLPDCQRVLLGGVSTVAETGLKPRGRGRGSDPAATGRELFHASCSLLAGGTKTLLVSRWQTRGKTHRDLLRELVLELPFIPADQAWRRSVALARRTDVDPDQEPRVKRPDGGNSSLDAEHPFLWAGYLLVDTGYDPSTAEQQPEQ